MAKVLIINGSPRVGGNTSISCHQKKSGPLLDHFFGHKKHPENIAIRAFHRAARSGIEPLILP